MNLKYKTEKNIYKSVIFKRDAGNNENVGGQRVYESTILAYIRYSQLNPQFLRFLTIRLLNKPLASFYHFFNLLIVLLNQIIWQRSKRYHKGIVLPRQTNLHIFVYLTHVLYKQFQQPMAPDLSPDHLLTTYTAQ